MIKKLPPSLKKLLSIKNFRGLLVYTLITSWAFYFGCIDKSLLSIKNFHGLAEKYLLLKFVASSLFTYFIYYTVPTFFLRLLFHKYIRGKIMGYRDSLKARGRVSFLKNVHTIYQITRSIYLDGVYRMGFFAKKDLLEEDIVITESDKEEVLNEILANIYKWICISIHVAFTVIFIWKDLSVWFVTVPLIILAFLLIAPVGVIVFVMNIDLLKRFRKDLVRTAII